MADYGSWAGPAMRSVPWFNPKADIGGGRVTTSAGAAAAAAAWQPPGRHPRRRHRHDDLVIIIFVIFQLAGGGGTTSAAAARPRRPTASSSARPAPTRTRTPTAPERSTISLQASGPRVPAADRQAVRPIKTVSFTGRSVDRLRHGEPRRRPVLLPQRPAHVPRPQLLQGHARGPARRPGRDFAEAYVIAHEYGHHIENLLGTMGRVKTQGPEQRLGEARAAGRLLRRHVGQGRARAHRRARRPVFASITQHDIADALDAARRSVTTASRSAAAASQPRAVDARLRRAADRAGSPPATTPATSRPATPSRPASL